MQTEAELTAKFTPRQLTGVLVSAAPFMAAGAWSPAAETEIGANLPPAGPGAVPLVPTEPWSPATAMPAAPSLGVSGPGSRNGPAQQPVSLAAAITMSLQTSDIVRVLDGSGVALGPATTFDPAIGEAQLRAAEAAFDPRFSLDYTGSQINQPSGSFFGPGIPATVRRDEGDLVASLTKPWATGGTTRIAYEPPLGYLFLPNGSSGLNPTYTSAFVFEARQPLMRGCGPERNLAPIRIAQIRADQSTWQVKQATMAQIRSIEEAYWDLQSSVVAFQSIQLLLPLAEEVLRIQKARFEAERVSRSDVARSEAQLEEFRQRFVRSQAGVQTREYRLRNLMSLPVDDSVSLVPVDPPRQQPVALDAQLSVQRALEAQPDLMRQQLDVLIKENELAVARNDIKPQFDLRALYRLNGLSDRLDTSLEQAFTREFTDWTLGATFSLPLGNRAANANLDAAELQLMRERILLQRMEENLTFKIAGLIREIQSVWAQYELTQRRVKETEEWVWISRVRFTYPPPAESASQDVLTIVLVDYQQALQAHLDAVTESAGLLAQYNTLLARYQETEGTLLDSRLVQLGGEVFPWQQPHLNLSAP